MKYFSAVSLAVSLVASAFVLHAQNAPPPQLKPGTAPKPAMQAGKLGPKVSGMPSSALADSKPAPVLQPLTAAAKAKFLTGALGANVEPTGLADPVALSAQRPFIADKAHMDMAFAVVNTFHNTIVLNGKPLESIVLMFRPAQPKPCLVTISVSQPTDDSRPADLRVSGAGINQTNRLPRGPSNMNVVVNASDTNFYRLELTTPGFVRITQIEITPMR